MNEIRMTVLLKVMEAMELARDLSIPSISGRASLSTKDMETILTAYHMLHGALANLPPVQVREAA